MSEATTPGPVQLNVRPRTLAMIVGGGFAIQTLSGKSLGGSVGAQAPGRRLELLPGGPAAHTHIQ